MDFAATLERLSVLLDDAGADWAVVGGLALAAHGAGRLTDDLDIATERRVQADLVRELEALGYETLHVSAGYSNHVHEDPAQGRIDVVYVAGATARDLFGEAAEIDLFPGIRVKVPRPEHLIAMKVLAAKNDATRRLQELADIVALLRATQLDADAVRAYFERHGLLEDWERVRDAL